MNVCTVLSVSIGFQLFTQNEVYERVPPHTSPLLSGRNYFYRRMVPYGFFTLYANLG